jgi:transcriptional regulator with XRE-family HTH domain
MAVGEERLQVLLRLFQGSIRAAGLSQTEVDERIGRRRGYLSHVFQGRVDLKLIDLLNALEALGVDPNRFFQLAFGQAATSASPSAVLIECFATPRPAPTAARRPGEPLDPRLLDHVRSAVRVVLAEMLGPREPS